jgi:hypothetical protein
MASRKIEDLHPSIQDMARGFLSQCSERGMHVIVTCTLRTMEEQAALYAQGREAIAAVNTLRAIAGMPPYLLKAGSRSSPTQDWDFPCTTSASLLTWCP